MVESQAQSGDPDRRHDYHRRIVEFFDYHLANAGVAVAAAGPDNRLTFRVRFNSPDYSAKAIRPVVTSYTAATIRIAPEFARLFNTVLCWRICSAARPAFARVRPTRNSSLMRLAPGFEPGQLGRINGLMNVPNQNVEVAAVLIRGSQVLCIDGGVDGAAAGVAHDDKSAWCLPRAAGAYSLRRCPEPCRR